MTDAAQHIATVEKNRLEDVRVALIEYGGRDLVDVRIFAAYDRGEERQPTRKGISLAVRQLPRLVAALAAALEEATRRGLMDHGGRE